MKRSEEFPFERARRATPEEIARFRRAIEEKLGVKRKPRGRPPKKVAEKYHPVAIRLHPKVLRWAKSQGRKRGLGYQTVINELLLKFAA